MADRRHPPNRLLAWERLQRGWSFEEVADRIRAEMTLCHETDTGLCANTVRRWETGERWPDPRYRKQLVVIFGMPASALGLLTADELKLCPDAEVVNEFQRLWEIMEDGIGAGGIRRGQILRGMLAAGTLPLLAPLLSLESDTLDPLARGECGPADAEGYATIAACQRTLYWTLPPRPLYEAAYAHTQLGVTVMRGAPAGVRAAMAGHVADSALLTARLAFFDLKQSAIAERCFEIAIAATRETGDHERAAVVIGHSAFVPIFSNQPDRARQLLDAARQHTWHGVTPQIRSWLHCVASEAEARAGNGVQSRHHIDLARNAFVPDAPMPAWMDFFDAGRLNSFAGYAALISGDKETACQHLSSSLSELASDAGKQRSVVLADLAAASGDGDLTSRYLHEALDALESDWYSTGLERVQEVRPQLGDSALGLELDSRMKQLMTVA